MNIMNIMNIMNNMNIMNLMNLMNIMNIINIMNILNIVGNYYYFLWRWWGGPKPSFPERLADGRSPLRTTASDGTDTHTDNRRKLQTTEIANHGLENSETKGRWDIRTKEQVDHRKSCCNLLLLFLCKQLLNPKGGRSEGSWYLFPRLAPV